MKELSIFRPVPTGVVWLSIVYREADEGHLASGKSDA
jgi:hypothetical protein